MILSIIISITASVVSGTTLFLLKRYLGKKDKIDEERHAAKRKENVLILKSINAVGRLTEANSIALRDGKTNGEMHEAMRVYDAVDKEMFEYLLEQNSKKI